MDEKTLRQEFTDQTAYEPAKELISRYKQWSGWKYVSIEITQGKPSEMFPEESYIVTFNSRNDPREEVDFMGDTIYTTRTTQDRDSVVLKVLPNSQLFFDMYGRPSRSCLGEYQAKQNILKCIEHFEDNTSKQGSLENTIRDI